MTTRTGVLAAVLLVAVLTAGCFGPGEDPVTTQEETGTTPGETVEAGGQPTGEPQNDTAIAEGTTGTVGNGTDETGEG